MAISSSLSWLLKAGIPPPPFVICVTAASKSTVDWSRFGPTLPDVPASERVWQLPHPADAKIALPAAGSPWAAPPPPPAAAPGVGGDLADHRLGRSRGVLAAAAGGEEDQSTEGEEEGGDAGHGARSIPAATAA